MSASEGATAASVGMVAPFRAVDFPPVDLIVETGADGSICLTPRAPLEIGVASVPLGLARMADQRPTRPHMVERDGKTGDWDGLNYSQMKASADAVSQWLIDRGGAAAGPLLIVSGNSVAHAVLRYGAMGAGVPVVPVSENYSLMGAAGGYQRLRHVVSLIRPGFVFAERAPHSAAIGAIIAPSVRVITREPTREAETAYEDVLATVPTAAVAASIAGLKPEDVAAYMLTSGSTGRPKAVIHTHGMIIANLFQGWQTLGRAAGWDDVLLEWLPWSHVSGAFSSMAAAIFGGTFHIDGGKPLPGLFAETLRNLREIPLKYFTNVPSGYAMLADALAADVALRRTFFQDLRLMLYGGAGLPQPLYDRIQQMAVDTVGERIFFTTGYGATETTSGCMSIYFPTQEVGIGLPMPGLSVKLVPLGDRYEVRMKGPMITAGYLGEPELNARIRDPDGFYCIGDTARFLVDGQPEKGLAFAGRLAEEFKLASGTFVLAGNLRMDLLKILSPLISELLVCGENRDSIGILAWPTTAGADALDEIATRLAAHNAAQSGSSSRIARFALLAEPPNAEAHELSDKGSINQALAKARRAEDIIRLFADPPPEGVLVIAQPRAGANPK